MLKRKKRIREKMNLFDRVQGKIEMIIFIGHIRRTHTQILLNKKL
jgi:hypothetical protein